MWLQRSAVPIIAHQRYRLINGALTWYEAQTFCRVKYTDLGTVNNMDDENKLVDALVGHVAHAWIGLRKGGGTGRWMWSDGSGIAHFTNWGDGEPNNVEGDEWCAEMSEKESWNDLSCGETKGFVCYERQQDGTKTYAYYSEEKTWVDSQEQCRSKHNDVAYIRTEADNSDIANLVKTWIGALFPNKVWIGLFKDPWVWSDGRETSFRFWLKGSHYRGNCAAVAALQQGRWVESQCDQKTTFVCQGDLKVKKMVIRLMVRSDVDLTNSTVSDGLLKKLEMDLTLQSVTDFSLSWRGDQSGLVFQRHEQLEDAEETGC